MGAGRNEPGIRLLLQCAANSSVYFMWSGTGAAERREEQRDKMDLY
jgi:hypothetical protein